MVPTPLSVHILSTVQAVLIVAVYVGLHFPLLLAASGYVLACFIITNNISEDSIPFLNTQKRSHWLYALSNHLL